MTRIAEETPEQRKFRREAAGTVFRNPGKHFYCEKCGCIFSRGGSIEASGWCPLCKGYRFTSDIDKVREQALRLRSKAPRAVMPEDYS